MIRLAFLGATLSSFVLLACNGCNSGNTPPPPTPDTSAGAAASGTAAAQSPDGGETVIRVDDDGKTFDVNHGSTVTFKLARDSATGFAWTPVGVDPNALAQQGDRSSENATSDVPGAPKHDVYHFVAGNPGTTTVEMDLKRAFGSAPPARVIHVTINIH